jgi:DNA polymerase-3 subunit epsilon
LEVGGVTRAQIMEYPPQKDIYEAFLKILEKYVDKFDKTDKFFLIGFNNQAFDNSFLRAFFKQCGDDYFGSWFWSTSPDVMVLATQRLMTVRHLMPNFKLMTVAKFMKVKVEEEKLHDAMYDTYITREIYKLLNKEFISVVPRGISSK